MCFNLRATTETDTLYIYIYIYIYVSVTFAKNGVNLITRF